MVVTYPITNRLDIQVGWVLQMRNQVKPVSTYCIKTLNPVTVKTVDNKIRVIDNVTGDNFDCSCNELEVSFVRLLIAEKTNPMATVLEKFNQLFASKEDKLLTKYNVENPIGTPTREGLDLLLSMLYKERRADVIVKIQEIDAAEEVEKKQNS